MKTPVGLLMAKGREDAVDECRALGVAGHGQGRQNDGHDENKACRQGRKADGLENPDVVYQAQTLHCPAWKPAAGTCKTGSEILHPARKTKNRDGHAGTFGLDDDVMEG